MSQTPETLQQKFNIPADLGTVKVPRSPHAFQGVHPSDRRTFLSIYYPLVMSGAIAAEGQHPSSVRGARVGVKQAQMAKRAGVHRTTITRRMSKLAAPAKGYEGARLRRAKAQSQVRNALVQLALHPDRCEACAAGLSCATKSQLEIVCNRQIPGLDHYDRPEPTPVLFRRRRVGMASRYSVLMAQRREWLAIVEAGTGAEIKRFLKADKAAAACARLQAESIARGASALYSIKVVKIEEVHHHAPSPAELAADPHTGAWWQAKDENGKPAADGYKARSRWVYDARIRDPGTGRSLDTTARNVMAYYEGAGLLEEWHDAAGNRTKPAGILTVKQGTVASQLGIDVKTVRRANKAWQRLGVLRIVSGEPRMTANGYRRGPQIVIYLPFRMLTEEEATAEEARMSAKLREIVRQEGAQRLAQLMEAKRIHGSILAEWRGREHCMTAFWRECGRQFYAACIFDDLITKLLPPTRPPRPVEAPPPRT